MSQSKRRSGRPNRFLGGVMIAAAVVVACTDGPASSASSGPLDAPVAELTEVFRLGGMNPSEPEAFERRPSVSVDQSGRVYVPHHRRGQIAVFGPDGDFMHWIGVGRGQGPNEFASATRMGFFGDTIWVRNVSPPRMFSFLRDGTLLNVDNVVVETEIRSELGPQGISGYLKDGRAWVEPDRPPSALQEGLLPPAALELLPRTPEAERRDTVVTWRSNRGRLRGLTIDPFPEPPFHAVAPDGSEIAVVDWSEARPETLALWSVGPDGHERWKQELTLEPRAVPPAEHDSIVRDARERVQQLREMLLEQGMSPGGAPEVPSAAEVEELVYLPDYRPPVRDLRLGLDGSLWLELPGDADEERWLAMDRDEGPLLEITLPEGATFGQASRDALWYAQVDSLGVPWVVKAQPSY